jgi:antitoxin YefM
MSTVSVTDAKTNLDSLVRETVESHEPILITSHGANAVLLSEDDWRSVQETLYLLSISGMRESIREGLETDPRNCKEDAGW